MASRSQTDRHKYLHTHLLTDRLACKQSALRQASRQALGLCKLPAVLWKIAARQTLCEDEASLEAGLETGLEAMEMGIGCYEKCSKTDTWLG